MQAARIFSADLHRKGIVESESWPQGEDESPFVFLLYALVNVLLVSTGLLFEDCSESGARVCRIPVNPSCQDGLLADVGSGEIKATLHLQIRVRFDLLRDELAENERFGEIFGSDNDAIGMRRPACKRSKDRRQEQKQSCSPTRHRATNLRSSHPTPKSAARAMIAAGIAPASMTRSSTMAKPRKMNSPRPPAPIAAAMVARPTEMTTKIRRPERINLPP